MAIFIDCLHPMKRNRTNFLVLLIISPYTGKLKVNIAILEVAPGQSKHLSLIHIQNGAKMERNAFL